MKSIITMWHNVRRSPYQAFAAVLIMMLTFMIISFFTFLLVGSYKIVNFFESKPQVTVFFKDNTLQSQINTVEAKLRSTHEVSSIQFISQQQALALYRQQNKNDPLLLDLVTANILPASLQISTVKIGYLSKISDMLNQYPFVQQVIFQQDVVSTLTKWTNALKKIGIALIVVFSFVSVFIIVTITGIKISQKKEDIEILRLVGASNWYIRSPFVLEGMFYGVIGSVIGWLVACGTLLYGTPFLRSFLQGIPLFPVSYIFLLILLAAELILAMILGAFASLLAASRYLKQP